MAIIIKQTPVDPSLFTRDIAPKLEAKPTAAARVLSNQASVDAYEGITAGQHLNVEYDAYFPPLPQEQGYGSAKINTHWKTATAEGDAAPVQDSGWWGYGTNVGVDLPKDTDGKVELTFSETRSDGVVIKDPLVYTADVLPADAPIIKLDENWNNSINGSLKRGGAFKVAYDVDRLRSQMNLAPGQKASITALVSFDGKYPTSKNIVYSDALGDHVDMPEFRIPDDASNVRMWFVGMPAGGKSSDLRYDSDYGSNFYADIG